MWSLVRWRDTVGGVARQDSGPLAPQLDRSHGEHHRSRDEEHADEPDPARHTGDQDQHDEVCGLLA